MRKIVTAALLALAGLAAGAPAWAQDTAAAAYKTGYRYDKARRLTGTISPPATGTDGPFVAVRNTYDAAGNLTKVEQGSLANWQAATVLPSSWVGFTIDKVTETSYDLMQRKVKEVVKKGGASTIYGLTQFSYDDLGRLECTVVRMGTTTELGSANGLNQDACTPVQRANNDWDRVTKNEYDAAGQLLRVRKAYGTPLAQLYARYEYSNNGKKTAVIDAGGNRAQLRYDGLDRQDRWTFPSKTAVGQVDASDYEQYGYDANDNRTSLRTRRNITINYTYDDLNRMATKDLPGTAYDVSYGYDLQGLQTSATFTTGGLGISNAYDGFGRLQSTTTDQSGTALTITHAYDFDGNRTQTVLPGNAVFNYGYDGLDRMATVKQGTSQIASITYKANGLLDNETRGGVTTSYDYDNILRLDSIDDNLAGTGDDVTTGLAYNPANQIVTRTRSNDNYAYKGYANVTRSYARNGLNQYTTTAVQNGPTTSFCYDGPGNLTLDGTYAYQYDYENRLIHKRDQVSSACPTVDYSGTSRANLAYDPLGRLYQTTGGGLPAIQYLYDGDELVAEYNINGTVLRRYVHGAGDDDPLIWYEGSDLTDMRSLQTDHQGSIVSVANADGTLATINGYDEYGVPNSEPDPSNPGKRIVVNQGTFQYTGQAWLPALGMYYYKARIYSPTLGRFLQTDPVGYDDQINLYAYVANDPVNMNDPSGEEGEEIVVTARRVRSAIVSIATTPIVPRIHYDLPRPVVAIAKVLGISEQCAESTSIEDCSNSDKLNALLLVSLPRDVLALGRASVGGFSVSAKHLLGAGGSYRKFATVDKGVVRSIVSSALRNVESASFQASSGNYVIIGRAASAIGSKGETGVKIVLSPSGKVITAYPVR